MAKCLDKNDFKLGTLFYATFCSREKPCIKLVINYKDTCYVNYINLYLCNRCKKEITVGHDSWYIFARDSYEFDK